MAKTANEEWFDALVRHQIGLLRLSGSIRNQVHDLLNATEKDIRNAILDRMADAPDGATPRNLQRAETLRRVIRNTRTKSWKQVNKVWTEEFTKLAKGEPEYLAGALQTTVPVVLDVNLPPARQLEAIATSKPFEGKTLNEWVDNIARADLDRIDDQIKIGLVQGESNQQIARRVVGSRSARGVNGVTEITRRNAAAITRTAVNHISNRTRELWAEENSDLFNKERYTATLDGRTTAICMSLDGQVFKRTDGPTPPVHIQCRSLRVPVIDGYSLAQRPSKPVTEKQLLREYARSNNIDTPNSRGRLPYGHKGSFDQFKRKRVRQMTGRVPGLVSYQEWLSKQSREFQDDVLGPTKGKLFREGNLKLDKFVNRKGDELNLVQLARREKDAFRAAGLDPENFL